MKGVGSDELRPSRRVSERVSEFERFTAAFSSLVGDDSLLPPWSEEPLRSGFGVTFGVASGDSFEPRFDPAPGDGESSTSTNLMRTPTWSRINRVAVRLGTRMDWFPQPRDTEHVRLDGRVRDADEYGAALGAVCVGSKLLLQLSTASSECSASDALRLGDPLQEGSADLGKLGERQVKGDNGLDSLHGLRGRPPMYSSVLLQAERRPVGLGLRESLDGD